MILQPSRPYGTFRLSGATEHIGSRQETPLATRPGVVPVASIKRMHLCAFPHVSYPIKEAGYEHAGA